MARLWLVTEFRRLGDMENALYLAKKMDEDFSGMNERQALIPVYDELSKIYEALSNSLMEKYYPETYMKIKSKQKG